MRCPKYGKEIADNSNFCMSCGVKISKQKNRKPLRIAIVVIISSVILAGGSYVFKKSGYGYEAEIHRFKKVLANASDEELFLILRLAIYEGYVPTPEIDPYGYIYAGVSGWHRTIRIYNTLKERNRYDLLYQIYPDKEAFDEYVYSKGVWVEREERDTTEMDERWKHSYIIGRQLYSTYEVMMQNLAPDSVLFDSIMRDFSQTGLNEKYFGTPLYNGH